MDAMQSIKADFPILSREVAGGKSLVYLDNAATTQKPQVVIDALVNYYSQHNANIHRGVHTLSEESSQIYEDGRVAVQKFIGARLPSEIIFTKNTTEAINLVAYAWGRSHLREGDEILVSEMEHHANLIPWQILAQEKGASLRLIPVTPEGRLDLRNIKGLITEKTKLLAVVHASNFLGTINDLDELTKLAKQNGTLVLIDAAQSAPHLPLNVQKLRADFLAFSSHKMLGPLGIGVLYIRDDIQSQMPPFLTGGGMIKKVDFLEASFAASPEKFEAGTPDVAGVAGFTAALSYLESVGLEKILAHERQLVDLLLAEFEGMPEVTVYGPQNSRERVGVVAFSVAGIHSHDLATILDEEGVAVRSGHHCVQPLHRKWDLTDSTRASFYLYNSEEDVSRLLSGIKRAQSLLL